MHLRRSALSTLLPTLLSTAFASATTIQIKGHVDDRQPNDEAYRDGTFSMIFTVDGATLPLPVFHGDGDDYQTPISNVQATVSFDAPPYDPPAHPVPVVSEQGGFGYIETSVIGYNEVAFRAGELSGYFFVYPEYIGNGPVFNGNDIDTALLVLSPGPLSVVPNEEDYNLFVDSSTILSTATPEPSSLLLLGTGALASASTLLRRCRRDTPDS